MKTPNQEKFYNALVTAYVDLFVNSPDYAYSASKCTPQSLAEKMFVAMLKGSGSNAGEGIKRACKICGIKSTYKEITGYLNTV